jgi:hypothetical protein
MSIRHSRPRNDVDQGGQTGAVDTARFVVTAGRLAAVRE